MKDRIGQLVGFYHSKLKQSYSKFLGKGVLGKELKDLLSESHDVAPENLIAFDLLGVRKRDGSADIPMTYEQWREKNPK